MVVGSIDGNLLIVRYVSHINERLVGRSYWTEDNTVAPEPYTVTTGELLLSRDSIAEVMSRPNTRTFKNH